MVKLPALKTREVVAILERAGFEHQRRTDHLIYKHPDGRRVSVPDHPGDIGMKTLRNIIRESGMTVDAFLSLR